MRKPDVENVSPPDKGFLQLTSVLKTSGLDYRANFQDYIKQKQHIDFHFQDQSPFFLLSLIPPLLPTSVRSFLHQIAAHNSLYRVFCWCNEFISLPLCSAYCFFFLSHRRMQTTCVHAHDHVVLHL